MGVFKKPKAPKAPDVGQILADEARYNRVDTATPFGRQTWTQGPGGRYTTQTEFSEPLQALFDQQLRRSARGPAEYSYQGNPMVQQYAGNIMGRMGMKGGPQDKPSMVRKAPQPDLPQIDMDSLLAKRDQPRAQQQAMPVNRAMPQGFGRFPMRFGGYAR